MPVPVPAATALAAYPQLLTTPLLDCGKAVEEEQGPLISLDAGRCPSRTPPAPATAARNSASACLPSQKAPAQPLLPPKASILRSPLFNATRGVGCAVWRCMAMLDKPALAGFVVKLGLFAGFERRGGMGGLVVVMCR